MTSHIPKRTSVRCERWPHYIYSRNHHHYLHLVSGATWPHNPPLADLPRTIREGDVKRRHDFLRAERQPRRKRKGKCGGRLELAREAMCNGPRMTTQKNSTRGHRNWYFIHYVTITDSIVLIPTQRFGHTLYIHCCCLLYRESTVESIHILIPQNPF
jgi:hypothetical protein